MVERAVAGILSMTALTAIPRMTLAATRSPAALSRTAGSSLLLVGHAALSAWRALATGGELTRGGGYVLEAVSRSKFASGLRIFAGHTKELVEFYRNGAAVAPPHRQGDQSYWYHRALVVAHVVASAWVGKLILASAFTSLPLALTAAAFVCLGHKATDPAHGLVHFTIDNYFSRTTPMIGGVVDGFLDHHDRPAVISRIQCARNVASLVMLSLPVHAALILSCPAETIAGISALSFLGVFFAEVGFSMEAHKYAHISRRSLPTAITWLQDREWLVPSAVHWKHHARRPGYEADYAAITGKANRYLTSERFRRIERAIYDLTLRLTGAGVEARSWRDPAVRKAAVAIAVTGHRHDELSRHPSTE